MESVQKGNDPLAQSGARSPSVLPAESIARRMWLRKNALCRDLYEESPESQWLFGAGLGRAAPTFSLRYRCEYAVIVLEEHDRLAARLRRSHRHCGLRRKDMASVQGLSSPQEAFRSPPGLLRGFRRDRRKETLKPEVNPQSLITV